MKVLLLTDADAFAGTERHMLTLAQGLQKRGIDVLIASPEDSPLTIAGRASQIQVVPIEKGGVFDIAAVRRLTRLLRQDGVDLIHGHNGRSAWLAALARFIARRGIVLTTMHFITPARADRRGVARLFGGLIHRFTRSQSSGMIAISDVVRRAAVSRKDLAPNRIHRVHNGVSEPEVNRTAEPVRAEFDIEPGTVVFLAATRLESEKAVGLLIEAARLLVQSGEASFRLQIVGRGSCHAELVEKVQAASLERQVQILGFREDVYDLMAASDVLVHSTPNEAFGLVFTEAMALGLPVIAASGGAAPEIVEDGITGRLFKAGDAESLAQHMAALLRDPDQRQSLGAAGYRRYHAYFRSERMIDETIAVYQAVLNGKPSMVDTPAIHTPTTN